MNTQVLWIKVLKEAAVEYNLTASTKIKNIIEFKIVTDNDPNYLETIISVSTNKNIFPALYSVFSDGFIHHVTRKYSYYGVLYHCKIDITVIINTVFKKYCNVYCKDVAKIISKYYLNYLILKRYSKKISNLNKLLEEYEVERFCINYNFNEIKKLELKIKKLIRLPNSFMLKSCVEIFFV